MTSWASELAKKIVNAELSDSTWDSLFTELTEGVDELKVELKKAKSPRNLSTTLGQKSIEIRDNRNRVLCFKLQGTNIELSCSWRPGKSYGFRVSSPSTLMPTNGEVFPGILPQKDMLIPTLAEVTMMALLQ